MKLRIKDAFHLVGYQVTAALEEISMPVSEAKERMLKRLDEVSGRTGEHLLSVSLGLDDGLYTQFIGVKVEADADAELPEGMEMLDLPSSRWVQFAHHGPVESIAGSIATMRQWADENDHPTEHVFIVFHPLEGDGPIDLLVRLRQESLEKE